jgi:hypothetical protein
MPLQPFALLCRLVDTRLAEARPDRALLGAIADPATPWPRLVTLSGVHLMTPAMAACLLDLALTGPLPPALEAYLLATRAAATTRNDRLAAQLQEVARCLNGIEIAPVLLKGAIRLVDGLYPDPAWRFLHDLDLLIPAHRVAAAQTMLEAAGWQPVGGEAEDGHHVTLVHPAAEVRLALHTAPLAEPYASLLPAARVLARARPLDLGPATVAVPALEDQFVHLVAHGMLQHAFLFTGRCLLRDLVELALLGAHADSATLAAAGQRFADVRTTAGRAAWAVGGELAALCLPGLAPRRAEPGLATSILARRMLLQQRSPRLMQLLGPAGWIASRALGWAPDAPASTPAAGRAARVLEQWSVFQRKTRW